MQAIKSRMTGTVITSTLITMQTTEQSVAITANVTIIHDDRLATVASMA